MNEYCRWLCGEGLKCYYQGDHYIVDSPSIPTNQFYAENGTPCNNISQERAEAQQQQYLKSGGRKRKNNHNIKN